MTKASIGEGTKEVLDACLAHRAYVDSPDRAAARAQRLKSEVLEICEEEMMRRLRKSVGEEPLRGLLDSVAKGSTDPYKAALDILGLREQLAALLAGNGKGR
jgi:putative protein kinase ArgK-like GTPase of G3E family